MLRGWRRGLTTKGMSRRTLHTFLPCLAPSPPHPSRSINWSRPVFEPAAVSDATGPRPPRPPPPAGHCRDGAGNSNETIYRGRRHGPRGDGATLLAVRVHVCNNAVIVVPFCSAAFPCTLKKGAGNISSSPASGYPAIYHGRHCERGESLLHISGGGGPSPTTPSLARV